MSDKEIRLPYKEFKNMEDTIEKQQEFIDWVKTSDKVVVVDSRYSFIGWHSSPFVVDVPKILGDSDVAKKLLQEEFDRLSDDFEKKSREFNDYKLETRKNPWWKL